MNQGEIFVEKFCSICGKISWDSQAGTYNETHRVANRTIGTPCNTNGTRVETTNEGVTTAYFPDGRVEKYDADGKEMEV
jgi:hypothetical protein